MSKIEKRYSTAISRPILDFLDLNDSTFNAKFVSGGYILLYDTGFYSEIKNGTVRSKIGLEMAILYRFSILNISVQNLYRTVFDFRQKCTGTVPYRFWF